MAIARPLADALASLGLPPAPPEPARYAFPEAHRLGAELPAGHLHVWGGPPGAGTTALLLGLLLDAARHDRTTLFATYDLGATAVARRLVAMGSGVSLATLDDARRSATDTAAAARTSAWLARLPLLVLEARGMDVAAIDDRLVRCPARVEVLGVDFLQAVVRPSGSPVEAAVADLADLAVRRHAAVVCATRAPVGAANAAGNDLALDPKALRRADRLGWVAPAEQGAAGESRATLLANRHGGALSCPLRLVPGSARWEAFPDLA